MSPSALLSLGYVAIYVVLVGVASFIEKPAGRGFGDFQLNALIRSGSSLRLQLHFSLAMGLRFQQVSTSSPVWGLGF